MFLCCDVSCCALRRLSATREQSPGEPHRHSAQRWFNSQPVRQQRGRIHVSAPSTLHQPFQLLTQPTLLRHCLMSPLRAWKLTLLETRRNPVRHFCSSASFRCLSVFLCSKLKFKLWQVFTYDPYDDSYQAVPMSRYQTVYISPGVGPGMLTGRIWTWNNLGCVVWWLEVTSLRDTFDKIVC